MKIIGIDPGVTGALAVINKGEVEALHDMPTMAGTKNKKQVNGYELCRLIEINKPDLVMIEKVHAMPGQGVSSMFNFGKSAGIIEGVCAGLGVPIEFVTPQSWKKKFSLIGKDKDSARTLAIQKHPFIAEHLSRKKDIGRADAIFIAQSKVKELLQWD